jgi:hypothetical protein
LMEEPMNRKLKEMCTRVFQSTNYSGLE